MDKRVLLLCVVLAGLAFNAANGQTLSQVAQRVTRIENALVMLRSAVRRLSGKVDELLSVPVPVNVSSALNNITAVLAAHSMGIVNLSSQSNGCCRNAATNPWIPATCSDVYLQGNSASGLYSVIQGDNVKQVFCHFSDPNNIMQQEIGNVNINTGRVYFDASRSTAFNEVGGVISYDIVRSNEGNGLNSSTGIFSAPKAGVYIFLGSFLKTLNANRATVSLQLNGDKIARTNSNLSGISAHSSTSLSAVVHLQAQDQVKVVLDGGALYLGEWQSFQGIMIHEDLIPLVIMA